MKDLVLHFLLRTWDTFSEVMLVTNLVMREKEPHKPKFAFNIFRIHSLMIYTEPNEYNFVGDTNALLLRCFPFISKLKPGDIIITGQYMNY